MKGLSSQVELAAVHFSTVTEQDELIHQTDWQYTALYPHLFISAAASNPAGHSDGEGTLYILFYEQSFIIYCI